MPRLIDAAALNISKFTRWFDDPNDRKSVERMIRDAPTIDPVHAAGGCYCGECGYLGNMHEEDGETSTSYCHCWGDLIYKDDFCSRGKRREENA